MSANMPQIFSQHYATNVELLLQQKQSRLRATATEATYTGKVAQVVDQLGLVAASRVTGRFQPMHRVDAPITSRWVSPNDYDLPQLKDSFDQLRAVADPKSAMVEAATAGMNRAIDLELINAVFGINKTGAEGLTSTSFDASQVVSVNQGASASGLNVAKLRAAQRMLMAAEVDQSDEIFCVITAKQHDDLLGDIQVVSRDFNGGMPILKDGKIDQYMGMKFVHYEGLPTGADDGSGTSTLVPVYAKSGLHLGVWGAPSTSISQRNDLRGEPWQAYIKGTFGATRLEEKKFVKVFCR